MGPCAKRVVRCTLVSDDRTIIAVGENVCATAQLSCPREPGEGYEKCKTICNQLGHAEEVAVFLSRHKFTKMNAYIEGHYRVCDNCQQLLKNYGVVEIIFGTPT